MAFVENLNTLYFLIITASIISISCSNRSRNSSINNEINCDEQYYLDNGFIGVIYVSYSSNSKIYYRPQSEKGTIQVPRHGLVKVKYQFSSLEYHSRQKCFYYCNLDVPIKKIDSVWEYELLQNATNYDKDSVLVVIKGLNQFPRSTIDSVFKEKIDGDVEMFIVDTLKNLSYLFE